MQTFSLCKTQVVTMIHTLHNSDPTPTYSQKTIKDRNSTLLFNLIRRMEPISRADLARQSGLSPATVTVLIDELLQNQWIWEDSSSTLPCQRGRRPILLRINASRGYVVTVDMSSQEYLCSLYDICLNRLDTESNQLSACSAENISGSIHSLCTRNGISSRLLLGIHVLYPGVFNPETGSLCISTMIPEGKHVQADLVQFLKEHFPQTLIMISNNTTAMAYSVYVAHQQECDLPLLAVSIHEGISVGIVSHHNHCTAVEAGHVIVKRDGPLCNCGNRGCLEAICSATALLREINEKTSLHLEYENVYGSYINACSVKKLAQALDEGNPEVTAILQDYAYNLSCAIVSLVNLFGIRSVYVGGILEYLGDSFFSELKEYIETRFHIVTAAGCISLNLFNDEFESSRKAAVILTMEQLFQRS